MLAAKSFSAVALAGRQVAQQSVHLTLGILRKSQAVSYAFSFFWLDGFAVPAPARVPREEHAGLTQTVEMPRICVIFMLWS
jgi:hypothetical protein